MSKKSWQNQERKGWKAALKMERTLARARKLGEQTGALGECRRAGKRAERCARRWAAFVGSSPMKAEG